jgi:hypothetical protein
MPPQASLNKTSTPAMLRPWLADANSEADQPLFLKRIGFSDHASGHARDRDLTEVQIESDDAAANTLPLQRHGAHVLQEDSSANVNQIRGILNGQG